MLFLTMQGQGLTLLKARCDHDFPKANMTMAFPALVLSEVTN